ncbi:hypothetical protein CMV_026820 [Castanea mollissima]|uniref:Uncharacterized protein n=1 Tax=Castanea mollissima TaxID=60419 RepID=A0A8J4QAI8_9ROSI|nr:hypothetical protein CMV_026820 [Castanea mollissima]
MTWDLNPTTRCAELVLEEKIEYNDLVNSIQDGQILGDDKYDVPTSGNIRPEPENVTWPSMYMNCLAEELYVGSSFDSAWIFSAVDSFFFFKQ